MATPFLERYARWIAVAVTLLASARIVATYHVFDHTFDEPVHIACGMEWLAKGTYTYEPQHPPLARVAAALGPFLMGIRTQGLADRDVDERAAEGAAILYKGGRYETALSAARLGILPFFWIACAVVYLWGERYFRRALGAVAVSLFSFIPTVLAHAGVATTDMALTAFLGAAFLTGLIWVEAPTRMHAVWFGLATGLAVLCKLSALAFLPAAAVVALAWYWGTKQGPLAKPMAERLPSFAIAVATGAVVIWAGYRFTFGAVDFAGIPLPAPALYTGIETVAKHEAFGHWSYLLGQRSGLGFWYFYPVALAFKTPLAFLGLLAFGAVLAFRKGSEWQRLWVPLAFATAILLMGMMGHINIGVRHILPVYLAFSLVAAGAVLHLLEAGQNARILAAALLVWFAASSLLHHPDYLAYFNELAGSQPEKILVDSDLDWGQDIKRLSRRLRELGAEKVTFPQFVIADLEKQHGFPPVSQVVDPRHPPDGYFAAGATFWKAYRFGLSQEADQNLWVDQIPPAERIGKGMFLWYFPPAAKNAP